MSLSARTEHRGGDLVVHLTGTVDRDAGPVLDGSTSLEPGIAAVELDVTDVEYINSSGIALLVGVLARLRGAGVTLRASGLTPHYRHIFEITRLDDFIEIVAPAAH
jgi:anti-sigma B factor antagonist